VPTMSSVSHLSIASCDGLVPSNPIVPVVNGLVSGTAAVPKSAFTTGAANTSAVRSNSVVAFRAPRVVILEGLLAEIENLCRTLDVAGLRQHDAVNRGPRCVMRDVALRPDTAFHVHVLKIDREGNVAHRAVGQHCANGEIGPERPLIANTGAPSIFGRRVRSVDEYRPGQRSPGTPQAAL
jgi:hypothetical protein